MKQWLLTDLIDAVKNELRKMGYQRKTIYMYQSAGFNPIKRYYEHMGELVYTKEITENIDAIVKLESKKFVIYDGKSRIIRKAASFLDEYSDTGTIIWRTLVKPSVRQLTTPFSIYFDEYKQHRLEKGYRKTTLRGQMPTVKQFLHYLEDCGIYEIEQVSRENVLSYLPIFAEKYKRPGDMLSVIRSFLSYLYSENLLSIDYSPIFRVKVPSQRRYYYGFTEQEINKILSAVLKETPCGKRDYAILLLAANTGIRAIDALKLKITDINWDTKTLNIIQNKTDESLILPLDIPTCNAIADYILNVRPEIDSPHIFIRDRVPYRKLESWSGFAIVKRAAARAGISWLPDERKGFHSVRRSLGNRLLESETPLSMISEILGHTRVDSSKPYMATHHSKLGMCALTLSGIETEREELQ